MSLPYPEKAGPSSWGRRGPTSKPDRQGAHTEALHKQVDAQRAASCATTAARFASAWRIWSAVYRCWKRNAASLSCTWDVAPAALCA